MPAKVNIAGQRFGRLTAVAETDQRSDGKVVWRCVCDCGVESLVNCRRLRSGNTRSCGCLERDTLIARNAKHGAAHRGRLAPEYMVWSAMVRRCTDKNDKGWDDYGGRGITVCERWRAGYASFIADMGRRPSPRHSIDRIDNDCGYEPGNCRWTTRVVQTRNRRVNRGTRTSVKGVTTLGPDHYIARITVCGDRRYLGYFSTIEAASEARRIAELELWGADKTKGAA